MLCAFCGYAVENGHRPDCIAGRTGTMMPLPVPRPWFDGSTFEPKIDLKRLKSQQADVARAMADGKWHTLAELAGRTGHPEASVSSRLRDLRKPRWGSNIIQRRRLMSSKGLWEYRLLRPESETAEPWWAR